MTNLILSKLRNNYLIHPKVRCVIKFNNIKPNLFLNSYITINDFLWVLGTKTVFDNMYNTS